MARPRNDALHEATRARILETARKQMTLYGTAGLGLRAIARELDQTPTALYRYFPSLDDLITALIVDAFSALADALEAARDAEAGGPMEKLRAVLLAYRAWAVANPTDFQLIYGNPIPGYDAPREVTVPAVVRGFVVLVGLVEAAVQSGAIVPRPPYDAMPAETLAAIDALIAGEGYPVSAQAMYLAMVAWSAGHGIVLLELFHHLQPVIGDPAVFYAAQLDALLRSFGAAPG
jgi:AcrR family transcriptional regulator